MVGMVRTLAIKIRNIISAPTEELGRFSRFLVFQIKLWPLCRKLLIKNRYGQQAAALSYHTLFGMIPLAIVMLLVFQLFPSYKGLGVEVKHFIYDNLQLSQFQYPDPADPDKSILLTSYIDELVSSFFEKSSKGSITIMSGLIVVWAAIGLLSTIERTFNNIWNVRHSRNVVARIFSYWTPLTLGPLLLGTGIYLTTNPVLRRLVDVETFSMLRPIVPYLISVFTFFILYWSIPNTKVKISSALWSAAVAALIWTLVKAFFRIYITEFIPYSQIYGVLGLIPLTVFWIYTTWKIILFGVQLTYTTQNLEKLDAMEMAALKEKNESVFIANEILVVDILRFICREYESGRGPVDAGDVYKALNLPNKFTQVILDQLVSNNLLFVTSDPREGYVPANNPENISLSKVYDAIAIGNLNDRDVRIDNAAMKKIYEVRSQLGNLNIKEILENSSADQYQPQNEPAS